MSDQWTKKLEPYLDGELSSQETREVEEHLRSCPMCTADVLRHQQLKRELRSAGRRFTPNADFKLKVQGKIAPKRAMSSLWRWALPAFAVLLVAIALYLAHQRADTQYAAELADLHVANLASSSPVDVVSTDRHTVKPWFQGKIPFTFTLPELQSSEFTLLGGRVAYFHQSAGAQLIYQARKHEISVFIFPDRDATAVPNKKIESFSSESWSNAGLTYFVIGDAGYDDIHKLAELFKAAAK